MKLIVGFLAGLVVGAVGAVAYSVQSGRDLREAYQEVRDDLSKRDLDALGARLESRVTEMQTQLEARIAQVREKAATAIEDARATAEATAEAAGEAAAEANEQLEVVADTAQG
jgi:gas vesicle protein